MIRRFIAKRLSSNSQASTDSNTPLNESDAHLSGKNPGDEDKAACSADSETSSISDSAPVRPHDVSVPTSSCIGNYVNRTPTPPVVYSLEQKIRACFRELIKKLDPMSVADTLLEWDKISDDFYQELLDMSMEKDVKISRKLVFHLLERFVVEGEDILEDFMQALTDEQEDIIQMIENAVPTSRPHSRLHSRHSSATSLPPSLSIAEQSEALESRSSAEHRVSDLPREIVFGEPESAAAASASTTEGADFNNPGEKVHEKRISDNAIRKALESLPVLERLFNFLSVNFHSKEECEQLRLHLPRLVKRTKDSYVSDLARAQGGTDCDWSVVAYQVFDCWHVSFGRPGNTHVYSMLKKALRKLGQKMLVEYVRNVEVSDRRGLKDRFKASMREIRGSLLKVRRRLNLGATCSIVLIGTTGVGKSRLVNSLLRNDEAQVARGPVAVTTEPTLHKINVDEVNFNLWDTPGLYDTTGTGKQYVKGMRACIGDVHLVLFCIAIPNSGRFHDQERRTMALLLKEFGEKFFTNCIIVITRANQLAASIKEESDTHAEAATEFMRIIQAFRSTVWQVLSEVGVPNARDIPIIPAGVVTNTNRQCLIGYPWYDTLWNAILNRGAAPATFSFMKLAKNQGRYRQENDGDKEEEEEEEGQLSVGVQVSQDDSEGHLTSPTQESTPGSASLVPCAYPSVPLPTLEHMHKVGRHWKQSALANDSNNFDDVFERSVAKNTDEGQVSQFMQEMNFF